MNIIALGHNHSTASVDIREQIIFTPERISKALDVLADLNLFKESVVLSTCNRNEIYSVAPDFKSARDVLTQFLYNFHRIPPGTLDGTLYSYEDAEAVEHLFAVASGVDSLIIGETQVFSQVKEAFRIASQAGSTGIILNKLFNKCFETSKKVRHLTKISHGAVSVSYAAVELAKKIFQNLEDKTVLLVGAGETGELTVKNLSRQGATNFIIANRTFEKAEHLARDMGGKAITLENLQGCLEEVDVLIASTSAEGFILSAESAGELMEKRRNSPLFIIDLAIPRDIDPKTGKLYNVFLYNIDDLSSIAKANKVKREKEICDANKIIKESAGNFMDWRRSLEAAPAIISLRQHFEQIRRSELDRYSRRIPENARGIVDETTKALINKLLHNPTVEMKRASENGGGHSMIQSIRRLFKLGESNDL